MNIKEEILDILENASDTVSGEFLAKKLNVSRNYIWKAIGALREEGYIIDAETRNGYCISNKNTLFSAAGISKYLEEKFDIKIYDTLASTNTLAKQLSDEGANEFTVIIAREQSDGKGRLGRSFHSARGGLYMSIILRPHINISDTPLITVAAAVAVSRAVDNVCAVNTGIKWVNDIFLGDKKICGILTQGAVNIENNTTDYVVLGIGLNISKPENDFPEELRNIAGSIYEAPVSSTLQNKLIAEILNQFFCIYKNLHNSHFIEEYRKRSIIIGKEVLCVGDGGEYFATVKGIDNNAHLIITDKNGKTKRLSSGEVRIKI